MRQSAPKKILVVDDYEPARTVISKYLAAENYIVIQASNGKEAYTTAVAEQPDLILLDALMPVMDGFEALWQIKEDPATQNIKVVMLTGMDRPLERRLAAELGADGCLSKPVRLDELDSCVKQVLGQECSCPILILSVPPPPYHQQN
jgi:two-component system cell cycle response regulator